ncbi:MAG: Hpt domain-containing protein [Pseudanabaenaceae cyanobacterium bins.68]|nr:Hpt domain-containing protein [Pseudanabaenaceae cyanobacterium bins.68]
METDKQKQITGYFIEESMEHLQTIENGLVHIDEMMSDPENLNEVFRAAHSIKGGAGMLGFSSIQYTAHKLEDYFKVLKDHTTIKIDQNLQNLFLAGFDSLKELLTQLQSPTGLTQDVADTLMEKSKSVFERLRTQLDQVTGSGGAPDPATSGEVRAMIMVFQNDIPQRLREMLELFKQPDRPNVRLQLQGICDQMHSTGEQFELRNWCGLIKAVKQAVANQNNSFRLLAPLVIKEVKQAQELVLSQKGSAIAISSQLQQALPTVTPAAALEVDQDQSLVFSDSENSWQKFGEQVGWYQMGSWLKSSSLNFEATAPAGHLPAPIWLASWDQVNDSHGDQLRADYEILLERLKACDL